MLQYIHALTTISLIAFALGIDAFSAALGLGFQKMRKKNIIAIGLAVGICHIIMPFIGVLIGKYVSEMFGQIATVISGILLCVLGLQMLFVNYSGKKEELKMPIGLGLALFAISVSLDSFSVGISLGMIGLKAAVAVFIFGVVASLMTWAGLLIGRNFYHIIGVYSRFIGSFILVGFGVKIIL